MKSKKVNHTFTTYGKQFYEFFIPNSGGIENEENVIINFLCFLYETNIYRDDPAIEDISTYWQTYKIRNNRDWLIHQKFFFYKIFNLFENNKKQYKLLYNEEYSYSIDELFDEYILFLKKIYHEDTLFLDSITSDINHVITKHKRFLLFRRYRKRLRNLFKQIIQSCKR